MDWEQCWLDYKPNNFYKDLTFFKTIYINQQDSIISSAVSELSLAFSKMFHIKLKVKFVNKDTIVEEKSIFLDVKQNLTDKSFNHVSLQSYTIKSNLNLHTISGESNVGVLYGVFAYIRNLILHKPIENLDEEQVPDNPLRMLNHWDNLDGSIERGYAGNSLFFDKNEIVLSDRIVDYARLVASIGINGVVINNVNVSAEGINLITKSYYSKLAKLSEIFSRFGIKLYISIDFAAPIDIGGLALADPLDQEVIVWWKECFSELFMQIPNLGGFLVKADSEGRPGPFTYGRDHSEGANMLAKAVKPFGAIIIWRCFVYNCQQDWRDLTVDRAKASYDNFMPLDGKFDKNVVLQIKNGPMDFQVREPVSPLFGAHQHTNQILEVQMTQEYTGQQKHVCYLVPMWKEILGFKTYCKTSQDTVADVISGKTYDQVNCGMAAVSNTGNNQNWTGHDLAGVNLYGFGRLSWNQQLSSEEIAREWIIMTYSNQKDVIHNISKILMMSWPTYEKYTSPLGIGWMVNPNHHFGPNIDGYEYDRWGTYHRADHEGIGVDRTHRGTGYTAQYFRENRICYDQIDTCPEQLLLFFHRVPYTYMLSTGKTLIEHIYDSHFEGVDDVSKMIEYWIANKSLLASKKYLSTLQKLIQQEEYAKEWRDVVNSYFFRKTSIPDHLKRKIY